MKLTIKNISCENYKGLPRADFQFYPHTSVLGKNAEGKSTLKDIYFDVMTGKMSDGTAPDNIRPHDETGRVIDHVPVRRGMTLDIDGVEYEIEKLTEQRWRVPKGQIEEVFDGNVTSYRINGFDKKAKDFDEWKKSIVDADTLLLCSNAQIFLNKLTKSTAEARKVLEELSGFDLAEFIKAHDEYKDVEKILQGNPIEDVLKQLKRNLKKQKDSLEKTRTVLAYEKTKDMPDDEIKERNEEIAALEIEIKKMALDVDDAKAKVDKLEELRQDIRELTSDKQALSLKLHKVILEMHGNTSFSLTGAKAQKQTAMTDATAKRKAIDTNERLIAELEIDKSELVDKYKTVKARTINMIDNNCPYCGQLLPKEKIRDLYRVFDEEKKKELLDITDRGNSLKLRIDRLAGENAELKHQLEATDAIIDQLNETISNLESKVNDVDVDAEVESNAEYKELSGRIVTLNDEAAKYADAEKEYADIIGRYRDLLDKKASVVAVRDYAVRKCDEQKERINDLSKQLKDEAQKCADIERDIDIIGQFSVAKNTALADIINPHFKHFKFSFLDYTQEGNAYETCKLVVNGTDYSNGLNGGDKKLVEIDLCRGLQELNNILLPIWIDEANTIDAWRIPKNLEQQFIVIQRTDEALTVKEGI